MRHRDGQRPSALASAAMARGLPFGFGGIVLCPGSRALVTYSVCGGMRPLASWHSAICCADKNSAPLTVRDRDREHRARHALQQHRGRVEDLYQREPCFELFHPIAHEARPGRSVPGINDFSAASIWDSTLHDPSVKVSGRAKNASNCARATLLKRIDFAQPSPAPSTSP